ncbi:MAG: CNNM domain-containing protein [Verrucomicrobiota bacterium]|nr:CNNM domain-containing protein [Verrucomicrobiota bacterium]
MTPATLFSILACFLFSALFSGIETGSYMINRIRLRQRERERRPSALRLSKLLGNPHVFIFTVLIGNNLAVFLLSKEVTNIYLASGMEAGRLLLGFIPWNAEAAATLTLMFPLFLFAEVGPKNLFRKKADFLMYRLAGLMRGLVWIFYPLTWPLKQLFRLLTRGMAKDPGRELHRLSPDALREYFSVGEKEGIISSDQSRMVDNATSMHEVPVRMLMIPFKKVPRLPDHATVADFKRLVARRETSYAVLMHKHSVVGLVSLFSVVNRKLGDEALLKPYAEDVLNLQENRNLKSVFYRLRRNPHHSAVVTDAHRHPVGFVRLEDIARYIVKK